MATLHKCRTKAIAFGEKVYFQHTHVGKEDDRKDIGVFVGMMDRSPTYLIANSSGVYGSPNVAAFPDEQAFDPEMALSISVRHHEYLEQGEKKPPTLRVIPASMPAAVAPNPDTNPVETAGGRHIPRRARIMQGDLERHGYTAGCPACLTAELGNGVRRGGHTQECRDRLEPLLGGDRVEQAQKRIETWATQQVQEDADKSAGGAPSTPTGQDADMEDGEVLEDAPDRGMDGRTRHKTPDRPKAPKRAVAGDEPESVRRRLELDVEIGSPSSPDPAQNASAANSPFRPWHSDGIGMPEPDDQMQDDGARSPAMSYAPTSPAGSPGPGEMQTWTRYSKR